MKKNILVIGGGKGIGLSICESMHPHAEMTVTTRTSSEALDALGLSYQLHTAGVDDAKSIDLPDTIHGLVYCPGSIQLKPFARLTAADFQRDFQQNVLGAIDIIQHCLPALKKANHASVVMFSTVAAKMGMPFHASIAASKSAVEGLCKSLAAEYASSGIRFNVIAPSLTDTPLAGSLLGTDEKREAAAKRHPLNRIGDAAEMAQLVKFLLSDDAGFISGQVIAADGGLGTLRV